MRIFDIVRERRETQLLAQWEAAIETREWTKILQADIDLAASRDDRLIKTFILAAREAEDGVALDKAEAAALQVNWPDRRRFAVAREFVTAGRPDIAWRLLESDPASFENPAFLMQARRIRRAAKDQQLRDAIQAVIVRSAKGGVEINPQIAAFGFPSAGSKKTKVGTVNITGSPAVHRRHVDGLISQRNEFMVGLRKTRPPLVQEYKDVFVDRHGQVWNENRDLIVGASKPLSTLPRSAVPEIETAFYGLKGTRGIYHWMVDRVPQLSALLHDDAPPMEILQSDRAPEFEKQTLKMLPLKRHKVTPVGDAVFVRRLITGRVMFNGMRYWREVRPVFDMLRSRALRRAKREPVEVSDRIYISRRDAKRRPMTNEADVEALMRSRGFLVVTMGDIPVWKQIHIAASAKVIVAPHGAGLAHLINARRGTRVVEILPITDGVYQLRFNYARLSLVLGHHYDAWLEPHIGDPWSTDLEAFSAFLTEHGI